jgi:predicted PurR-regulated permease PerM
MSYQNLPDPRPTGVRLALRRMSRMAAIAVTCCLFLAFASFLVFAIFDGENVIIWGVFAVAALLIAGHYVMSIRWADFNQAWPRHRSSRRRRSHSW